MDSFSLTLASSKNHGPVSNLTLPKSKLNFPTWPGTVSVSIKSSFKSAGSTVDRCLHSTVHLKCDWSWLVRLKYWVAKHKCNGVLSETYLETMKLKLWCWKACTRCKLSTRNLSYHIHSVLKVLPHLHSLIILASFLLVTCKTSPILLMANKLSALRKELSIFNTWFNKEKSKKNKENYNRFRWLGKISYQHY